MAHTREQIEAALESWAPEEIGLQTFDHERINILLPSDKALGNDFESRARGPISRFSRLRASREIASKREHAH